MMNIILLIAAFFFMEFVAWFSHKYVMHGFLWSWHQDHHINDVKNYRSQKAEGSQIEKNDRFFLIYASPGIALIVVGIELEMWSLLFAGIGIALYGFTYFTIHDVMIHGRLNIPFIKNSKSPYLKALRKAHEAHHHSGTAEGFGNFGLLFFPKRYYEES